MLRKMLLSPPAPPDAAYAFALRSLSSPHLSIAQPLVTLVRQLSPMRLLMPAGGGARCARQASAHEGLRRPQRCSAICCRVRITVDLVVLTAPAVLICTPSCLASCASAKPPALSTSVCFRWPVVSYSNRT